MKREGSPEYKRKDQVIEVDHQPAMAHQLRRLDQLGQFPTRIKHARLHGRLAAGWPRVSQYVSIARGTAGNVSTAGQIADFTADFRLLLGALGDGQRGRAATLPKRQRRRRSPVGSVSSDL